METEVKKYTRVAVIRQYFGDRQDQNSTMWLQEFGQLSTPERQELAAGAAKELGLTQDQCDFPLIKAVGA